jgi:hypothetical protein
MIRSFSKLKATLPAKECAYSKPFSIGGSERDNG